MKFNIEAEAEARKKHDPNKFKPMDLNEDSIRAMVERCFATRNDPDSDVIREILISANAGFKKQDSPAYLSKSRSEANLKNIKFLFGQLAIAHKKDLGSFPLRESMKKYDGTIWADNITPIAYLFYLSKIFGSSIHFSPNPFDNSTIVLITSDSYVPTLSPKDPNFPAWWEEHKAEWED